MKFPDVILYALIGITIIRVVARIVRIFVVARFRRRLLALCQPTDPRCGHMLLEFRRVPFELMTRFCPRLESFYEGTELLKRYRAQRGKA